MCAIVSRDGQMSDKPKQSKSIASGSDADTARFESRRPPSGLVA
jgi:hypothetical protein